MGPQRVRIPPTPRTWRGALRPEAAAEPPGPSAPRPAVPRVRTHLGHQLGRGTGPRLSFPSPGLAGLCGAWNSAVFRTCGPGSLRAGADEVRPERDLCRPGVGLRVPMTATVTVALGNAFLRCCGFREGGQGVAGGSSRPRGKPAQELSSRRIGNRTGGEETGPHAQSRTEQTHPPPRPGRSRRPPRAPSGSRMAVSPEGRPYGGVPRRALSLVDPAEEEHRARVQGRGDPEEESVCDLYPSLLPRPTRWDGRQDGEIEGGEGGFGRTPPAQLGGLSPAEPGSSRPGWAWAWPTRRSACSCPAPSPRTWPPPRFPQLPPFQKQT